MELTAHWLVLGVIILLHVVTIRCLLVEFRCFGVYWVACVVCCFCWLLFGFVGCFVAVSVMSCSKLGLMGLEFG